MGGREEFERVPLIGEVSRRRSISASAWTPQPWLEEVFRRRSLRDLFGGERMFDTRKLLCRHGALVDRFGSGYASWMKRVPVAAVVATRLALRDDQLN